MSYEKTTNVVYLRHWDNFIIIIDCLSWANVAVGVFVIFVMYKMRLHRSRVLVMVMHLFFFQSLYVTSFISQINPKPFSYEYVIDNPFDSVLVAYALASGVSMGFVTNFISFTLLFVFHTGKASQPNKFLYYFMITVPGLAFGIPAYFLWEEGEWSQYTKLAIGYQTLRLVQVSMNFLAVIILYYRIAVMSGGGCFTGGEKPKSEETSAFRALAFRLVGYPIVGAIQRLSCSLYSFYAGGDYLRFVYTVELIDSDPNKSVTILIVFLYIWAILAPSMVIMDTALFLYFQKGAFDACKYYLLYAANRVTCGFIKAMEDVPGALLPSEDGVEVSGAMAAKKLSARLDCTVTKEEEEKIRAEVLGELAPSELMDIIVRQRTQSTASTLSGMTDLPRESRDSFSISSDAFSVQERERESNAIFLLDYIMDTSDEPGVSPEEATRNRKQSRHVQRRWSRGSSIGSSMSGSSLRGSSLSNLPQSRPPRVSTQASSNPIHEDAL